MTSDSIPPLRVLKEQDIKDLLDIPTAIKIIERTYRDYGAGVTQRLSDPPSLFAGSGRQDVAKFKVKGATLISEQVTGLRLVSDLPSGREVRSYHLLYICDDRTGLPIGLLDETWLHRFRTALTGVVAAKYLARPDSHVVALIGAGAIASQLFPALTDCFDLEEVRVVARRLESARKFCQKFDGRLGPRFVAMDDSGTAIDGADIVITLTFADQPVVLPGMLARGSFLCSMGETEEVDMRVLDEVDRFIVDQFDYATVLGDIAVWLKKGWRRAMRWNNGSTLILAKSPPGNFRLASLQTSETLRSSKAWPSAIWRSLPTRCDRLWKKAWAQSLKCLTGPDFNLVRWDGQNFSILPTICHTLKSLRLSP